MNAPQMFDWLNSIYSAPMDDDPIKELCDILREYKVRVVFWVCPNGCRGRVVWNHDKTDATCQVCGRTRNETAPIPEERERD